MEARGKKGTKEGEAETYTNQGASNSPLLGDTDHTGTQSKTSKGLVPDPEVRGGDRKQEGRKRTLRVLDRWPPEPGSMKETTPQRRKLKRLSGATKARKPGIKEEIRRRQEIFLREWLVTGKEGESSLEPDPESS